ncbi:DUF4097 family beta strand repeat-containing protein [Xylanimonas protaetiae]|uniref:Uncharacterized protein n=1 Tax=Xylanimonas protaetiae TaxID=2509457 RepID=A0A4P6F373_9MICO|nr:DUF4097 family beta strand repeat-containing protein [Xylanimonas protaetiae]QAY69726.1 hypothetical protein ET471_06455 [Xylanimonas protaetiae]
MSHDQQPPVASVPGPYLPPGPYPPPAPPRRPHKRVFLTIGLVVGLLLVAQAAVLLVDLALSKVTTTHESYDAVAVVELVADGDVNVSVGTGGVEVDAVAHSGIRSPRYSAEERADRLVVTHRCGWWGWGTVKCSGGLDVTVPEGTEVVVRTANGDVTASRLTGTTDLRSSNGRVEAANIAGPLTVRTSNGDIAARNAGDGAELRTSNGSIEAVDVVGDLVADTSNGRVDVRGVDGDARATTSNGRIDMENVRGNVVARTSNGGVTVRGTDEPVRLTISTSNGSQTVRGRTDPDATRTVEIRSSNGDVAYLAP